jgi:transcriptional regulator
MYIPTVYREDNPDTLVGFMRANSFATLVSVADSIPVASHIPLIIGAKDGVLTLTGHLAKANPQWRAFGEGEALAIFTGPHAYVSPTWYEKRESVPTWNYVAVHAYGVPRRITFDQSKDAVETLLARMIATYEATYQVQWDSLPEKFRDGMMSGIVGFEMTVTRLEGKSKLSQNRSPADQANVAGALRQSPDPAAAEIGERMRANLAALEPEP